MAFGIGTYEDIEAIISFSQDVITASSDYHTAFLFGKFTYDLRLCKEYRIGRCRFMNEEGGVVTITGIKYYGNKGDEGHEADFVEYEPDRHSFTVDDENASKIVFK